MRTLRCYITNLPLTKPVIVNGNVCERETILAMIQDKKLDLAPSKLVSDTFTQALIDYVNTNKTTKLLLNKLDDIYRCPVSISFPEEQASYCMVDGVLYSDTNVLPWLRIYSSSPNNKQDVGPYDLIRHPFYESIHREIQLAKQNGRQFIDLERVFPESYKQPALARVPPFQINDPEMNPSFRQGQLLAMLNGFFSSILTFNLLTAKGYHSLKYLPLLTDTIIHKNSLEQSFTKFLSAIKLNHQLASLFMVIMGMQLITLHLSFRHLSYVLTAYIPFSHQQLMQYDYGLFAGMLVFGSSHLILDSLYLSSQYFLLSSLGLWKMQMYKLKNLLTLSNETNNKDFRIPLLLSLLTLFSGLLIVDSISRTSWPFIYVALQFAPIIVRIHFMNIDITEKMNKSMTEGFSFYEKLAPHSLYLLALGGVMLTFFYVMDEITFESTAFMMLNLLSSRYINQILYDYEIGRFPLPVNVTIPLEGREHYFNLRHQSLVLANIIKPNEIKSDNTCQSIPASDGANYPLRDLRRRHVASNQNVSATENTQNIIDEIAIENENGVQFGL